MHGVLKEHVHIRITTGIRVCIKHTNTQPNCYAHGDSLEKAPHVLTQPVLTNYAHTHTHAEFLKPHA